MAALDLDAQALGDGVEAMVTGFRFEEDRQQQRIEHQMIENGFRLGLLELQELHVEGGVVGNQHRVADEVPEFRQDVADAGLVLDHVVGDAVKTDGGLGDFAPRIDQSRERLAGLDVAIDDAHPGDGDDFVAMGRPKAGGFRIEDDERQRFQRPAAQFVQVHGVVVDVELGVFGPGRKVVLVELAGRQLPVDHGPDDARQHDDRRRGAQVGGPEQQPRQADGGQESKREAEEAPHHQAAQWHRLDDLKAVQGPPSWRVV